MFIDVHCHLDMLEKEGIKIKDAIENARKKNVKIIIINGINQEHNRDILELSKKFRDVKAALGIYPIDALSLSDSEINNEINFIKKNKNKIIAIGEIGLDLKEENADLIKQKKIFSKLVKLGIKLNKPVIVHSRKAELECIELLEQLNTKKVIMHCFTGKIKLCERIAKNGWYLSIPSCVKYVEQFQKIVDVIPIDNLLCETDSPYLHPDKKWPNEPANVVESYKKIAEIKKMSLKDVERKIEDNFARLFYGNK